ncbi:DUF2681 domain-containing protein [Pasteurella oralis]|uniref:DUF2681 domain-containing protein n=1 Tax=Pasteurella oralis TaxID=1071947 RepID=A0ABW4NWW1_9PAST
MNLQIVLVCITFFLALCAYVVLRLTQAKRRIETLLKENEQLHTQKTVVETQIKHHQTRKQHEENARRTHRDHLIKRLHTEGDLRDE